jgi:hypothetical protein
MSSKVGAVLLALSLLTSFIGPSNASACTPGMAFVADVTVPDGTHFQPGQAFDTVWRLRNKGTCDWSARYALANVGGQRLTAADSFPIDQVVPAGSTVDLTVKMQAPQDSGTAESLWALANDSGMRVGEIFYVRIIVDEGVATDPGNALAPAGPVLIPDQPNVVWLWGAPNADHADGDVLPAGRYGILKTEQDGSWTQIDFNGRTPWVFTGPDSGTHEENATK